MLAVRFALKRCRRGVRRGVKYFDYLRKGYTLQFCRKKSRRTEERF